MEALIQHAGHEGKSPAWLYSLQLAAAAAAAGVTHLIEEARRKLRGSCARLPAQRGQQGGQGVVAAAARALTATSAAAAAAGCPRPGGGHGLCQQLSQRVGSPARGRPSAAAASCRSGAGSWRAAAGLRRCAWHLPPCHLRQKGSQSVGTARTAATSAAAAVAQQCFQGGQRVVLAAAAAAPATGRAPAAAAAQAAAAQAAAAQPPATETCMRHSRPRVNSRHSRLAGTSFSAAARPAPPATRSSPPPPTTTRRTCWGLPGAPGLRRPAPALPATAATAAGRAAAGRPGLLGLPLRPQVQVCQVSANGAGHKPNNLGRRLATLLHLQGLAGRGVKQ